MNNWSKISTFFLQSKTKLNQPSDWMHPREYKKLIMVAEHLSSHMSAMNVKENDTDDQG